jgi:hypothetical protein
MLVSGTATVPNSSTVLWAKVVGVIGDGTNDGTGVLSDGSGPVTLNVNIPQTAIVSQIIPKWRTTIDANTISSMIELIFANKPFGLRYDTISKTWKIVFEGNLNIKDAFSLGKQGNNTNQQLDSSWLLLFTTDTEFYTVKSRRLRYIFESKQQIRFYYDSSNKIFDSRSNSIVKDKIKVLNVNTKPDVTSAFTYDLVWEINKEFIGLDGYVDTKKIELSFSDSNDDGIVDNPELFEEIVDSVTSPLTKYIVLERYDIAAGQQDYRYVSNDSNIVLILATEGTVGSFAPYVNGQYFYFVDTATVKKLDKVLGRLIPSLDYKVFSGRDSLKFQYVHSADYETRIDPGLSNIVDLFILTREYDTKFRQWILGNLTTEPLPSSTDQLSLSLSPSLNSIKAISDEIVYHPVRYKVLFGSKASADVRAAFKIIKNAEQTISDNEIKANVLAAINEFFALENWDFGDSFYFSELSAYVMNQTSPYLVNFVIVPRQTNLSFGSLFEIRSESDQLFINGATTDDIEIISGITSSVISASGNLASSANVTSQQNITSKSGSY